jgi:tetratricopeptide (TPR) repeat protein
LASALRFDEAVATYEEALKYAPHSFELRNNLGNALRRSGHGADALAQFAEALRIKPGVASVELNFAGTLDELNRSDEAIATFDRMIAARPEDVDAHYNRAQALLSAGRLAEGWAEFPWRLKRSAANVRYEHFKAPVWQGGGSDRAKCPCMDGARPWGRNTHRHDGS